MQGTGLPYLFDVVVDLADADEAVIVLVLTATSARDGRGKVYATTCVTVRKS